MVLTCACQHTMAQSGLQHSCWLHAYAVSACHVRHTTHATRVMASHTSIMPCIGPLLLSLGLSACPSTHVYAFHIRAVALRTRQLRTCASKQPVSSSSQLRALHTSACQCSLLRTNRPVQAPVPAERALHSTDVLLLLLCCCLLQVGAKELKDGNLHPNPDKVEGFVVHAFDLDQCRTNRLG